VTAQRRCNCPAWRGCRRLVGSSHLGLTITRSGPQRERCKAEQGSIADLERPAAESMWIAVEDLIRRDEDAYDADRSR
jgi:hypothetical protein